MSRVSVLSEFKATKAKAGSSGGGSSSGSFSSSDIGKGLSTFENIARYGASDDASLPNRGKYREREGTSGLRSHRGGTKNRSAQVQGVTSFTEDDAFLLSAICDQVSDTFRKHQSFAVSSHYGAENPKIRSLLNEYVNHQQKVA